MPAAHRLRPLTISRWLQPAALVMRALCVVASVSSTLHAQPTVSPRTHVPTHASAPPTAPPAGTPGGTRPAAQPLVGVLYHLRHIDGQPLPRPLTTRDTIAQGYLLFDSPTTFTLTALGTGPTFARLERVVMHDVTSPALRMHRVATYGSLRAERVGNTLDVDLMPAPWHLRAPQPLTWGTRLDLELSDGHTRHRLGLERTPPAPKTPPPAATPRPRAPTPAHPPRARRLLRDTAARLDHGGTEDPSD